MWSTKETGVLHQVDPIRLLSHEFFLDYVKVFYCYTSW
jgi:hypothetical protein